MRKERLFRKRSLKAIVAIALATALAVPVTTSIIPVVADEAAATTAVPKRLMDFNEGLKEYNSDEALKLEIVKTEDLYVYKTEEEKEKDDRFDANNLLIMGNGSGAYYKLYTVSNQPCTCVDAQRGTVLFMGKTVHIDAVKKEKSAAIEGDDDATAQLDKTLPVPEGEDKTVQEEMTVRSELNFNNPIADSTSKFTVSMWIKIPTVEGVTNELAGAWHHVAVAVDGDSAAYYLDGVAKENATAVEKIKAWVASAEGKLSIGGTTDSAKAFAEAFGIEDANAEIMIDDLAFYTEAVAADKIAADVAASSTEATPVAVKVDMATFEDISKVSADEGYPGVKGKATTEISKTTDTVNGKTEAVVSVPENKKGTQSTGAYITNPFAGKELDGATISFWTKQNVRSTKGSDGTETTPIISFIDSIKMINHDKSNAKGEAFSMLSITSDGVAHFKEGFSDDSVANNLKNIYKYAISGEDRAKTDVTKWYNVTLVMNNGGFKMYINGKLYDNTAVDTNGKSIAAGTRFCDGYFQRIDDNNDIKTKYNIFGGTNNQYATALMDYITSDDIKFFLGYVPSTGSLNVKSNPTDYAAIRTFDTDLTEEQVVALYNNSAVYDPEGSTEKPSDPTPTPGGSDVPAGTLLGDANEDTKVNLQDASLVLKAALNIMQLDGQAAINADADKSGKINLTDASLTLKAALNIVTLK